MLFQRARYRRCLLQEFSARNCDVDIGRVLRPHATDGERHAHRVRDIRSRNYWRNHGRDEQADCTAVQTRPRQPVKVKFFDPRRTAVERARFAPAILMITAPARSAREKLV